jgi:hypothetical protein
MSPLFQAQNGPTKLHGLTRQVGPGDERPQWVLDFVMRRHELIFPLDLQLQTVDSRRAQGVLTP